jgi:hypothetical protein
MTFKASNRTVAAVRSTPHGSLGRQWKERHPVECGTLEGTFETQEWE